ncbi:hypothetical protein Tco_1385152 [Tanacetum coccineum]
MGCRIKRKGRMEEIRKQSLSLTRRPLVLKNDIRDDAFFKGNKDTRNCATTQVSTDDGIRNKKTLKEKENYNSLKNPSKKIKLRTRQMMRLETILRKKKFEKSAQDKDSLEGAHDYRAPSIEFT